MKKIIISVFIIGCLLSTALVNVSGKEAIIKTADVGITVKQTPSNNFNYDKNSMIDYSYTFYETDLNSEDSTEVPLQSGGLDFAVTQLNAWYSPLPTFLPPEFEGWNYTCYTYSAYNIGGTYTGSGYIKILFTYIYPDGTEHTYTHMSDTFDDFTSGGLLKHTGQFSVTSPEYDWPTQARVEIVTDLPDINPENNVKTVNWETGVTFWGRVYEKDISGNIKYPYLAFVNCDSDYDGVGGFGTPCAGDEHPWYTLVAPKDPNKPAYKYKLVVLDRDLLRLQTKYSDPLNGMSYREIFFTFFKIINQNSQSSQQSVQQSNPLSPLPSQPISTQQSATTPTSKSSPLASI